MWDENEGNWITPYGDKDLTDQLHHLVCIVCGCLWPSRICLTCQQSQPGKPIAKSHRLLFVWPWTYINQSKSNLIRLCWHVYVSVCITICQCVVSICSLSHIYEVIPSNYAYLFVPMFKMSVYNTSLFEYNDSESLSWGQHHPVLHNSTLKWMLVVMIYYMNSFGIGHGCFLRGGVCCIWCHFPLCQLDTCKCVLLFFMYICKCSLMFTCMYWL